MLDDSERTLKLPIEAVQALAHQRSKLRGPFVPHSEKGRPLQRPNVGKPFGWAQSGLDSDRLNLHGLRHTALSILEPIQHHSLPHT